MDWKKGQKFRVITKNDLNCDYGEILTLAKNYTDYTFLFLFEKSNGDKVHMLNKHVEPYHPSTCCDARNFKEGDKFIVVGNSPYFDKGTEVTLFKDDGSYYPLFICYPKGKPAPCSLTSIIPCLENSKQSEKTPCEILGLKKGDTVKALGDIWKGTIIICKKGDILVLNKDDGTDVPEFFNTSDKDRVFYAALSNVWPYTPTPCELLGYKEGDTFITIKDSLYCPDVIVTLAEDDGTDTPLFTRVGSGIRWYVSLKCVAPYTPPTPCEKLGYKEGDKFITTKDSLFCPDIVVTLAEDIGTDTPLFTRVENGESWYVPLECVAPYTPPTPCELLGYKEGDRFVVIGQNAGCFYKGITIQLTKDNGTEEPRFIGVGSGVYSHVNLKDVVPIEDIASIKANLSDESFFSFCKYTAIQHICTAEVRREKRNESLKKAQRYLGELVE